MTDKEVATTDKQRAKAGAVILLEERKGDLAKLVGPEMIEQFMGAALSCITKTPKLLNCRPSSFFQAAHHCAVLGLMPGPMDEVYLIPYGKECQAQVGYKGYITLATRHHEIKKVDGKPIYQGDDFEFDDVSGFLKHKRDWQAEQKDDDIIGAWAAAWRHEDPLDHPSYLLVFNRQQIEERRERSKQAQGNFWNDNYPAMVRKTAIRALLNGGAVPRSTQLSRAIEHDIAIENAEPTQVLKDENVTIGTPVEDGFDVDILVPPEEADPLEAFAAEDPGPSEEDIRKTEEYRRMWDDVMQLIDAKSWKLTVVHSMASDVAGRKVTDLAQLNLDELEQLKANL